MITRQKNKNKQPPNNMDGEESDGANSVARTHANDTNGSLVAESGTSASNNDNLSRFDSTDNDDDSIPKNIDYDDDDLTTATRTIVIQTIPSLPKKPDSKLLKEKAAPACLTLILLDIQSAFKRILSKRTCG